VGLDAGLAAAVTLQHQHDLDPSCPIADRVTQFTLAHVLLDGGYDGVVTVGDVLPRGDQGLGAADRLDGEVVVVDGVAWRVDSTGRASVLPSDARLPFVVVTTLDSPVRVRLRDTDLPSVTRTIAELAATTDAVIAVRLEGSFEKVLLRSVAGQVPPYRPIAEVIATDEVRFEHQTFDGVFVGFQFPDVGAGAVIPGLHLHGLDVGRTTGGHNYELSVLDAELSVSTTRNVAVALPDHSMTELLSMPDPLRAVQRALLRRGPLTSRGVAAALDISLDEASERLTWLADRGYVSEWSSGLADLGGQPRWRMSLQGPTRKLPASVDRLLGDL
jgi:acetolactate decarboxylase